MWKIKHIHMQPDEEKEGQKGKLHIVQFYHIIVFSLGCRSLNQPVQIYKLFSLLLT